MNLKIDSVVVWFSGWSFLLAMSWVLPNHVLPWTSFHSEVWASFSFLLVAPLPFFLARNCVVLTKLPVFFLFVVALSVMQFAFIGNEGFFGRFFLFVLYVFGFVFVGILTKRLDLWRDGVLVDFVCLAIVLASVVSVVLQVFQWLSIDVLGVWLMDYSGGRPYANLGQVNNLATLLMWGVLSVFWAYVRKSLGGWGAVLLAAIFLFGVALCQSRVSLVSVVVCLGFVWFFWRKRIFDKNLPWVVSGLVVFYFLCVFFIPRVSLLGGLESRGGVVALVGEVATNSRWDIWAGFFQAALDRPFLGYGVGRSIAAYLHNFDKFAAGGVVFSSAHNIFLDFIIWWGFLFGGLFFLACVYWIFLKFKTVYSEKNAVLCLFVLVIFNHSMFEYPLCYAYFVLPLACFVFSLDSGGRAEWGGGWFLSFFIFCFFGLGAVVYDYRKFEPAYRLLEMEWRGFFIVRNPRVPDLIVFDDMESVVRAARVLPREGMSVFEINELRRIAYMAPRPALFHDLALSLALNGNKEESLLWIDRLCRVYGKEACVLSRRALELNKQI